MKRANAHHPAAGAKARKGVGGAMVVALMLGAPAAHGQTAQEPPFAIRTAPQAPIVPDTAAALAAFTQENAEEGERMFDAALASDLMAGLGHATGLADIAQPTLTHATASLAPSPFKAKVPDAALADAGPPIPANLGNHSFGSADRLALAVNQHFASSSAFATDVALAHAAGPLDIHFDLTGNKALSGGAPVALSYASSALVAVGPVLAVGMVAHGDLGTTADLAPGTDQIAGPVAKLRLIGQRASLNAETGYNFHMNPGATPMPGQFHMNLNLDVKL